MSIEPESARKEKEPTTLKRLTSIFGKHPHEDFPVSEPFEGPLNALGKRSELAEERLDSHVSAYHHGRSDEVGTVEPVAAPSEHEKKPDALTRITSLFTTRKSTLEHGPEFPVHGRPFDGPIDQTRRHAEIDPHPIQSMVSVYHSGQSAVAEQPTATPAARKPHYEDHPSSAPYEGELSQLTRRAEHSSDPLEPFVSVYHHGRSDVEQRPTTSAAIDGGFPSIQAQPYDGPVGELGRSTEVDRRPIDGHVSVYHSGRSDEPQPPHHPVVELAPTEAEPSALSKITSIFKRSSAHDDFPRSEPFTGPLVDSRRHDELSSAPIDSLVSVYHHGRSVEKYFFLIHIKHFLFV